MHAKHPPLLNMHGMWAQTLISRLFTAAVSGSLNAASPASFFVSVHAHPDQKEQDRRQHPITFQAGRGSDLQKMFV